MNIFICDDNADRRKATAEAVKEAGHTPVLCSSGEELLARLQGKPPALIFLHLILRDLDGLGMLAKLRPHSVIMTMDERSSDMIGTSMKAGAADCVVLPLLKSRVEIIFMQQNALSHLKIERDEAVDFEAHSPRMLSLLKQAEKASKQALPVLITGEAGTGKSRLARRIHRLSGVDKAFMTLDCVDADIVFPNLTGFIYFKNIDKLPFKKQTALMALLKDLPKKNAPRLVASAHVEIINLVRRGDFLSDLYYYFSVMPLSMPALAQRSEDLPAIYKRMMVVEAAKLNRAPVPLPDLSGVVSFHFAKSRVLEALIGAVTTSVQGLNLFDEGEFQSFELLEREIYMAAFTHFGGNFSDIAKALKVGRSTVYRKFGDYGLLSEELAA
jgi:DNA-binding NtrC family response regulator